MESMLKIARGALLFLAALVLDASGNGISGRWGVQFTGGEGYLTVSDADFDFKADGGKLTGRARVGDGWPGTAPISEGKIDGDHISFRAIGKNAAMNAVIDMRFVGTVHGDELELTMTIDDQAPTHFKGKKAADK
jgi:hypothetical protein